MAEDELKKYDRWGGDGSMSASGDGIGSGVGMGGNDMENSTSVSGNGVASSAGMSGNGSVGAGEGLEGASGAKVGYEEGFGEKAQDGALEGAEKAKRAGNRSKKAYIGVIVALVVVILAAVGITIAVIWGSKELVTEVVDQATNKDETEDNQGESDEVIELSLNNQLVQRLYNNFEQVGSSYSNTMDFYIDEGVKNGDVAKGVMLDIALAVSAGYSKYCKGEHILHYGEGDSESFDVGYVYGCYNGEKVRQKVREIFGKEIEIDDGEGTGGYCGMWKYDVKNDEFFSPNMGCGGSCLYQLTRELNRAEKYKDKIYLYETVYGGTCQSLCHVNGELIAENEYDEDGNLIKQYNFDDYKDKLDQFKWTFTKNADGEYVFEGLEKVN